MHPPIVYATTCDIRNVLQLDPDTQCEFERKSLRRMSSRAELGKIFAPLSSYLLKGIYQRGGWDLSSREMRNSQYTVRTGTRRAHKSACSLMRVSRHNIS